MSLETDGINSLKEKGDTQEGTKELQNSGKTFTIVMQEPDGKTQLLQRHNTEDLFRTQNIPGFNNNKRRSTIQCPEQVQTPSSQSHCSTPKSPTNSIIRRNSITRVLYPRR